MTLPLTFRQTTQKSLTLQKVHTHKKAIAYDSHRYVRLLLIRGTEMQGSRARTTRRRAARRRPGARG